jgi:hypothetical protein
MPPTTTGAHSATGRTRKPLGWLPWVVLLVLAAVIALVVLIVVNANDDDNNGAAPVRAATGTPAVVVAHVLAA